MDPSTKASTGVTSPAGDRLRPATAVELQSLIGAERAGAPFLLLRGADEALRLVTFPPAPSELTVGRNPAVNVVLTDDNEVSGLHAQLEHRAGEITLIDDGLSRNGSFVNGERVISRRRLRDGDRLRFGRTELLVRRPEPAGAAVEATVVGWQQTPLITLSQQQRRVLVALCRPIRDNDALAAPATNKQIADELFLSVPAVKLHLRTLSEKLELGDLPQNQKRLALAMRARQIGLITDRELADGS